MKKYIIGALCLAAGLFAAKAETPVHFPYYLVVETTNGETVQYKFADKPVATFDKTDMILTMDGAEKVTYPMDKIAKLTFKEDKTGVESIAAPGASLNITITNTFIAIDGLNAGEYVRLFDLNGRLVADVNANADGAVEINVEGLDKGVYAVATPRHSFKFIK